MSIESYIAKERLRGVSEKTLKDDAALLNKMISLNRIDLEAYLQTLKVSTRTKRIMLIKRYHKFIGSNALDDLELPINRSARLPKALTDEEVNALTVYTSNMSKNFTKSWELRMLFHLGLYMGLRLDEILQVSKNSIDESGKFLKIIRKGNVEAKLPIPGPLKKYLRKFDGFTLDRRRLGEALAEACKKMGIRHIHAHMLRHTFATRAVQEDARNLYILKEFMGHKSIKTTEVYISVNPSHLSRLVDEKE